MDKTYPREYRMDFIRGDGTEPYWRVTVTETRGAMKTTATAEHREAVHAQGLAEAKLLSSLARKLKLPDSESTVISGPDNE